MGFELVRSPVNRGARSSFRKIIMPRAGVILIVLAAAILSVALLFLLDQPADTGPVIVGAAADETTGEQGALISEIDGPAENGPREILSRENEAFAAIRKGPCLSGSVTDSATGDPVAQCAVGLWEAPTEKGGCRKIKFGRCYIDSQGRFAIPIDRLGLRADGSYNLVFTSRNHTVAIVDSLHVPPQEGLAGIRAPLEKKGLLRLRGAGFDVADFRRLTVALDNSAVRAREKAWRDRGFSDTMIGRAQGLVNVRSARFAPRSFNRTERKWVNTFSVAPGAWTITVSTGAETVVRETRVPSGGAITVEIERQTLRSPFTVLGSLAFTDGSPVEGARIFLFAEQVPSLDRNATYRYVERGQVYEACRSDAHGEFRPKNLVPGQWRIDVHLEGGGRPFLPYVIIPADPPDPCRIDLVVARGSVSGTLCDQGTHLPLEADFTEWFFLVRDCGTGRVAAELNNHIGTAFRVAAVPAGKLRLEVRASGFDDYRSDPFTLAAGQNLNLGDLDMARTSQFGSLLLSIVDLDGAPFEKPVQVGLFKSLGRGDHHEALLPGQTGLSRRSVGWNTFRFDHIPAREIRVVLFEGLQSLLNPGQYPRRNLREFDVTIKADEVTEIRLSVDPRFENR